MSDFGVVSYAVSLQRKNPVILYESAVFPGKCVVWTKDCSRNAAIYYRCQFCLKKLSDRRRKGDLRTSSIARVKVKDGRFLSDPDRPRQAHICDFHADENADRALVYATREILKSYTEIRYDQKRPCLKHLESVAVCRTDEKYSNMDEDELRKMERKVAGKGRCRQWVLEKNRQYFNKKKVTPQNLPASSTKTVDMEKRLRVTDDNQIVRQSDDAVGLLLGGGAQMEEEIRSHDTPAPSLHSAVICIDVGSAEAAEMIARTLAVDKEPMRSTATRIITTDQSKLVVTISSSDRKYLYKSVENMFNMCELAKQTYDVVGAYELNPHNETLVRKRKHEPKHVTAS